MKLYHSPSSPFVRKCLVVAIELGLDARIERVATAASPVQQVDALAAANPLGKIPVLETDDGERLFDSRVICEYLITTGGGALLPAQGAARWRVLTMQALGDGMLDAAVLLRYEQALRPEPLRWTDWMAGQRGKIVRALDHLEPRAAGFGDAFDLGLIAVAAALGYLDFRHPDIGWRTDRPALAAWYERIAERASMRATVPAG